MAIKRTHITFEIEMQILGVYHSGITNMTEIVEWTKVSDDTVRRVLKKHGLKVSSAHTNITPEIRNRVKELRASGMTYKDIAVEMHIGISTTRDICAGHKKKSAEVSDNSAKVEVEQPVQLTMDVTESAKEKRREALLMIREAINILIEGEDHDSETE